MTHLISAIGKTELSKCERAEYMVRKAIENGQVFTNEQQKNIKIFAQGSYRNSTNITTDSDIAVCYTGSFYTDFTYVPGLNNEMLGYCPVTYTLPQFRSDVIRAVKNYFGQDTFTVGNKSLKISGNSYRIRADIVPSFEYRLFCQMVIILQELNLYPELMK